MSWLSENYEKATLGGGLVVGLGLVYMGWSALKSVETEFSAGLKGSGSNDASVVGADRVPKARASFDLQHTWEKGEDATGRPVDLFTGVPLFIKSSDPGKVVDLLKDPPVHEPIENLWWLENGLDPGFANSLDLDPDKDGYSNLEEYHAKSDPVNVQSFPPLVHKLKFVSEESLLWVIRPSSAGNEAFTLRYLDNKRRENRVAAANPAEAGDLFFADGVQKGRFKLLGSIMRKEMNPKMNVEQENVWVQIEDQRPNKKGLVYEFPAPLKQNQMDKFAQFDRTAVFSLEALDLYGKEFKVEENTLFALPPNAEKREYLLKSVLPEKVVIEFKNAEGVTQTLEIPKGFLPAVKQ